MKRWELAENTFDKPVVIVTQEEAVAKESSFSEQKKTWKFKAQNVRDFGFSTSRKFIIDQIGHTAAPVGHVAKRTNAIRAAQDDLIKILSGKQTKPNT